MSHEILLILLGVLLFGGILSGAPVSFVLLGAPFLVAILGVATGSFDLAFVNAFPSRAFGLLTNPIFVAVPLFVLMGSLLFETGLARSVYSGISPLLDRLLPGGLLHSNIVGGAILAACSGSSMACCAMLGSMALPEMERRGYERLLASGSVAAALPAGCIVTWSAAGQPPIVLLLARVDHETRL